MRWWFRHRTMVNSGSFASPPGWCSSKIERRTVLSTAGSVSPQIRQAAPSGSLRRRRSRRRSFPIGSGEDGISVPSHVDVFEVELALKRPALDVIWICLKLMAGDGDALERTEQVHVAG